MSVAGKTCGCCKRLLPAAAYNHKSAAKDGLQDRCRECNQANMRRFNAAHPGKSHERPGEEGRKRRLARQAVKYAVATGLIHKPARCEHCHIEAPLEGHHPNYDQPLNVTWLCHPCHMAAHRKPRATVAPALKIAA